MQTKLIKKSPPDPLVDLKGHIADKDDSLFAI